MLTGTERRMSSVIDPWRGDIESDASSSKHRSMLSLVGSLLAESASLDSNADAQLSFTNALGMISTDQGQEIEIALERYPRARSIVALHHHVVESPRAAKALCPSASGRRSSTATGSFAGSSGMRTA